MTSLRPEIKTEVKSRGILSLLDRILQWIERKRNDRAIKKIIRREERDDY